MPRNFFFSIYIFVFFPVLGTHFFIFKIYLLFACVCVNCFIVHWQVNMAYYASKMSMYYTLLFLLYFASLKYILTVLLWTSHSFFSTVCLSRRFFSHFFIPQFIHRRMYTIQRRYRIDTYYIALETKTEKEPNNQQRWARKLKKKLPNENQANEWWTTTTIRTFKKILNENEVKQGKKIYLREVKC